MLIVSTTKTVQRYIDRSYSWLRKKEGGQNRIAQWCKIGKSMNEKYLALVMNFFIKEVHALVSAKASLKRL